jgi:hypothetical protein
MVKFKKQYLRLRNLSKKIEENYNSTILKYIDHIFFSNLLILDIGI